MDLFNKCYTYETAKKARESGLYPYFQELTTGQDTQVVMNNIETVMIGSNNYLGLTSNPEVIQAGIDALKKYGFKGYTLSTGGTYVGDSFNIERFLFIKAYALNVLEVCEAKTEWADPNPNRWGEAKSTNFSEELELLLFDM